MHKCTQKHPVEVLFACIPTTTSYFDVIQRKRLGMDPYRIRLGLVSKEIEIIPDDDSLDFPYGAQLEPSPGFPPL